jgi:hypothetical protein
MMNQNRISHDYEERDSRREREYAGSNWNWLPLLLLPILLLGALALPRYLTDDSMENNPEYGVGGAPEVRITPSPTPTPTPLPTSLDTVIPTDWPKIDLDGE